jgi:predicted RNA-binding Zn ribbon-like protein
VNEASASAAAYPVLVSPGIVHLRTASGDATGAILGAIARSAIELLGGPDGERIRSCAASGCGRVFVATRPGRTWCSNDCGNRTRVARHYARSRASRDAS